MSKSSAANLDTFADENKTHHGPRCGFCALEPSLRQDIEDRRKLNPIKYTLKIIHTWLSSVQNIPITLSSVRGHFQLHVK